MMERIHSRRRYLGKRGKLGECARGSRRV